ncbi:ankyrin [Neocallimastix californiae]|uniref:Ankyrin n=1 Tax=Neocallimastix californiae TaxID=1754190 RepID=A0A1Y2AEE2_9FUNG|nr:ankyrin [Neocallimastix californiae]|eukprot:ORY20650.1 ankyrin [Neocallimastix californiae]
MYDYTPIIFAIYEKSFPLVELLIEKGAKVTFVGNEEDDDDEEREGREGGGGGGEEYDSNSPLINAIETLSIPIVQRLIEKGANVNLIDQSGYNPLVYAIDTQSLEMVKLLVEHGANIHHHIEDDYGREITMLTYAIILGYLDIIRYLISCHAEISFDGDYTYTDLVNTIHRHGQTEIFGDLAKYEYEELRNGFTSGLLKSIIMGDILFQRWNKLELLEELSRQHLDFNAKDSEGNTALVYAIEIGDGPIANFLIDHGADLTNRNQRGESIFDISAQTTQTYWGQKIYERLVQQIKNERTSHLNF